MVRVRDLEFAYPEGDFRLRIPELALERGARTAFIGPSGSGKTTLLNLISGVAQPQKGRIWIGGAEMTALSEAARRVFRLHRIGMVFQEFELLEYLTVLDNILLPYRLSHRLRLTSEVKQRALGLAARVAIGGKLGRYVGQLSHGERQRVGLCRALLTEPELVLADEPTAGLDPASKALVLGALLEDCQKRGATLITVTHDAELLPRFERVIDLREYQAAPARAEVAL
jgi:putative ABC transport system ATP-binding protein